MAGCGDVLSLEDLQTAKKHQIFEAEVITGKVGGVAGGAYLTTATNPVTGQVQETLPEVIANANAEFDAQIINIGFTRVGTFSAGATLTNPRQTLLWDIADGGDGQEYGWSGMFPKIVPALSDPNSTGGIAVGAWISRFDPELRAQVREALRRSYAEAGYNLTPGSFEVGGTVTTSTDVLLYEAEGKAFSWGGSLPKTVSPGSAPQNTGGIGVSAWTDRSDYATNATSVNAAIFVSLQAAVDYASSTGKKLIVDGDWTVPALKLTKWGHDKPWYVEFNGKITVTTRLDFMGMDACHIRGGVFICPAIYIQGVRHSSFSEMDLRGKIYIGKWDGSPAGASWSLYWNNFISVQFDAIYVRTTLTNCGINSNTFDTCVFRDNQSAGQLWHIDVPNGQTDPVMTSNTFVGCDWSYAPAWNFAYDYGYSFSATVIGGYLDTSTPWLKPGSYGGVLMDVVGLRNPSGERLESRTTSAIKMTTGGARPSKSLPVGAVSMVKNPPKTISGPGLFNIVNAPFDGDYTLTIILKSQVGVTNYGIGTIYNDTTGASYAFVTKAGHNSVTFSANAGDAIRVTWGITSGQPTIVVEEFSMTPGAGIYSAVKRVVAEPYEYDSGLLTITTTPTIALTITPPSYRLTSREVLITTLDPDGGGGGLAGGGERIKASLVTSSGSSISSATLQEYARALVNGTGSSSDDPSPVVVTTSISGLAVNILLSVASGTVNARVRATYDDSFL